MFETPGKDNEELSWGQVPTPKQINSGLDVQAL